MKLAFAGTPEFARTILERLAEVGHEVALVLTQPDRASGRGMRMQPSPVKALALERGWPVLQPASLRLSGASAAEALAAQEALAALKTEVLVVAAYGLLLPRWVLDLPPRGCLNVHASLLPRWRGAAPVQRAIEAGDPTTGVTIMQMDAGLDTGDIVLAQSTAITPDDTSATLHARLGELGAALMVRALEVAEAGALSRTPQPVDGVTYANKIDKGEAPIDWTCPAVDIERRLRAFDPFPGSTLDWGELPLKCWRADVLDSAGRPGELLAVDDRGPVVACGRGALRLTVLQRPGGRRMAAATCLQGRALPVGTVLAGTPT